jgi:hypothetical protein
LKRFKSSNGHGGRRAGAGRKPGVANKRTRAIVAAAAAEGVMPLEVMLQAMRAAHAAGDLAAAAAFAKDAAPYLHPKLASVEVGGAPGLPPVPVEFVEVAGCGGAGPGGTPSAGSSG